MAKEFTVDWIPIEESTLTNHDNIRVWVSNGNYIATCIWDGFDFNVDTPPTHYAIMTYPSNKP